MYDKTHYNKKKLSLEPRRKCKGGDFIFENLIFSSPGWEGGKGLLKESKIRIRKEN